jgi:ABC-type multidrug transport system fused ATPase/permease subunit
MFCPILPNPCQIIVCPEGATITITDMESRVPTDFLTGKTRVLVTHQLQYLQAADRVAVVDKQTVLAYGTYADVTAEHPHLVMDKKKGGSEEKMGTMSRSNSKSSMSSQDDGKEKSDKAGKAVGGDGKKPAETKSQAPAADGKTITKEKREAGSVKMFVWKRYAACMGLAVTCYLVGSYVFSQSVQLASDYSLSAWSGAVSSYEADVIEYEENNKQGEAPIPIDTFSYLAVYAGLTVLAVITVTIRGFFCTLGTIRGAVVLHDTMLNNVMRAPTKFFDTTPTGRVLNRFSSDQYTADNELRQTIQMMLMCLMRVACVAAVIIWVTPTFVVCVIPMGLIYYKVQAFFRQSSREMKRLESIAKSPIFAGFSETITGVSTIRAFGKQEKFSRTCFRLNDAFARAYYANNSANRWLGIRLECIGNVAVGASALFAVINAGDPSTAGLVGLSISYALEVTGVLNWLIRTFTQLESYMVAIERIDEYSRMDTEAAAVVEANRPSYNWPESGALAFEDVWMRYRDELDPALRGIDFKTGKGEKIGIVGRTGAGKSSLAVALFRMTEIYKGKVTLDGIDVKTIGLRDLRSRMSIIPQDPVLFSGNVRKNLDPFDDATDSELWEALEKVGSRSPIH